MVMSTVTTRVIGVALLAGSSQNQKSRFGANDFKMHPIFPKKLLTHYLGLPPSSSNLEFRKEDFIETELVSSLLAHSISPLSINCLEIEIELPKIPLISFINMFMHHIWNLHPNTDERSILYDKKCIPSDTHISLIVTHVSVGNGSLD